MMLPSYRKWPCIKTRSPSGIAKPDKKPA